MHKVRPFFFQYSSVGIFLKARCWGGGGGGGGELLKK